ncbi:MAG: sugar kinase [Promethearchaeota archaeon]|nr:MAG: sugar kinase [Candidatus Lokiarchaeota archaeon]
MSKLNCTILTFGEIMLRLSPPNFKRFTQTRCFDAVYGGGEANVAVSLANFGFPVEFVTCLPKNDLGLACIQYLRQYGVNTEKILLGGKRIGIYFLEVGASARASKVIYDREDSAISTASPDIFDWQQIFKGISWFHWTGITPAISQNLADICLDALQVAKSKNIMISCDLNYRSKLWKYGKNPKEIMPRLLSLSDIAIGNEEDAEKVLGIKAPDTDITSGKLDPSKYQSVVEKISQRYPNLKYIAITLRGSLSASHNTWSGVLYDRKRMYTAPHYDIAHIIDRVGGGDSFAAGLIYGLQKFKNDPQKVLNFAIASSCLKHTIFGDFNLVSVEEVFKIMKGDLSGRVRR